jgi:Spy/CpxP family protein refolding chaperone
MTKNLRSSAVLLSLALTAAVASIPAVIGTVATYAQQAPPPDSQYHGKGGPRHHDPNAEFETKMLTRRLSLTPDQAAKVEPILASQDEQLKALRPQPGTQPDFKAMHEQRKAIMEQTKQQLAGVLTPDQLTEFDKMHGRRGPGGPHGNWQGKQGTGAGS